MVWDEIEIPKEVRSVMLEDAKETSLGQKNGANKQFRYGNLHIREYDDKFLVHMDKVDPRKDPLGHLVFDAPEVLVGLASAVITGSKVFSNLKNNKNSKQNTVALSLLSSLVTGYLGYSVFKKLKE